MKVFLSMILIGSALMIGLNINKLFRIENNTPIIQPQVTEKLPEEIKSVIPKEIYVVAPIKFDFKESELEFSEIQLMSEVVMKKISSLVELNDCKVRGDLSFVSKKNSQGITTAEIVGTASCKRKTKFEGSVSGQDEFNLLAYEINVVQGKSKETFTYTF